MLNFGIETAPHSFCH